MTRKYYKQWPNLIIAGTIKETHANEEINQQDLDAKKATPKMYSKCQKALPENDIHLLYICIN